MDYIEEESILERFKANYNSFPVGKIDHCDKPDFIVHGSKIIGIELTQIFQDQESSKGSFLRSIEEYKVKILKDLIHLLNHSELRKAIVSVSFNYKQLTKTKKPQAIAEECFKDILLKFRGKSYRDFTFYTVENLEHLPKIIDSYDIWFDSNLVETEYVETTGSVGKILTSEDLQFILDKKERALKNFATCDLYWLIIKEGSFGSDYFPRISIERKSLKTTYDKIFILSHSSSPIIEVL